MGGVVTDRTNRDVGKSSRLLVIADCQLSGMMLLASIDLEIVRQGNCHPKLRSQSDFDIGKKTKVATSVGCSGGDETMTPLIGFSWSVSDCRRNRNCDGSDVGIL